MLILDYWINDGQRVELEPGNYVGFEMYADIGLKICYIATKFCYIATNFVTLRLNVLYCEYILLYCD